MIKMPWTIVPENVDDREVLQVGSCNIEEGLGESKGWMDDNVDGNYGKGGIDFSPLEVVFGANLDGRGRSEAEGDDRTVNGAMTKLAFSPISLKGSQLPVRPPIVMMG